MLEKVNMRQKWQNLMNQVTLLMYSFSSRGCTCPARTRACKHSRMVKEWESRGRPVGLIFNDNAEVIWKMEF